MDSTEGELTVEVIIMSMTIVFMFALVVILFFVVYQRRLLKQENIQREKELAYQKDLLAASIEGQEQERLRIAKDLHDDVGTMLTTARTYFEQYVRNDDNESRDKLSSKMDELLGSTIQSVREISHDLRPVILEKLGFVEAISALVETLNETKEIEWELLQEGDIRFSAMQSTNVYRILQELIANTMKHAQASRVTIQLIPQSDSVHVIYTDDGIGIQLDETITKKGIGMKNIESRLSVLPGEIHYEHSTRGFHVEMVIPLKENSHSL